jgi:hypothetical protein
MSFFQQQYNHQFPQLGLKNTSTSPVPQHKGNIYSKKTNPTKPPFDHLPNIWLFGQGVLRHDGNWENPPWFGILEAIFIKTFGSNWALTSLTLCYIFKQISCIFSVSNLVLNMLKQCIFRCSVKTCLCHISDWYKSIHWFNIVDLKTQSWIPIKVF